MKKKLSLLLALPLLLTSCSGSASFGYELDFEKGYNKNLWYKNDLESLCADPSIVYDESDGYYYMYMTTDEMGCRGYHVYRSKQLNYWENLGPCFVPDPNAWAILGLWAPNVIKIGDKYYMYYTGQNWSTKNGRKGISVAVSEKPYGPFHEYEGTNYYGDLLTRNDEIFEFGFPVIDADPFLDDDGTLYLYFTKDQVNRTSTVYGVKMLDPVTPLMSSLTLLSEPGKVTTDASSYDVKWERKTSGGSWNEAPFMLKIKDKYYLTYSANIFTDVAYGVGYAIGDSPLGKFTKPYTYECENLLLGVDTKEQTTDWDFMSGTGHHCFFYAGDELMIGYHAHLDRVYGASTRAFALDRVIVDEDGSIFVNGPTYSLQHLPYSVSGYDDVARYATLTTDSVNEGSLLIDGKIPMHKFRQEHVDLQAKYSAGKHKITIEFPQPVKATAVAIYNSLDYDTGLKKIDSVNIQGVGEAKNVKMNPNYMDYYKEEYDDEYLRPGCPFIVEFEEKETKKITITVSSKTDFALSEVVVLGKGTK